MALEHLTQRAGLVQAGLPGQQGAEGPEPAAPGHVGVSTPAQPDRAQMLALRRQLVLVAGLGQRGGVDRAGTDAGDDVEPVAPLRDEMLAGPDLPAPLRSAPREYERPAHGCGRGRALLGGEERDALVVEGGDAFRGVRALEELLLQLALERLAGRERELHPRLHGALDEPHGSGRLVRRTEL